ncbi:hypothetical protein DERF_011049 [Dermatophagoides farinae]|uniref:Uncharacterized protein n=1 Tax=Dermatophagoides farinae TaxID=6954 RepID=A0A922HU70_DERFA|nr:hypothetical protein DERF_011049 [Dermatophagoides farinae]
MENKFVEIKNIYLKRDVLPVCSRHFWSHHRHGKYWKPDIFRMNDHVTVVPDNQFPMHGAIIKI